MVKFLILEALEAHTSLNMVFLQCFVDLCFFKFWVCHDSFMVLATYLSHFDLLNFNRAVTLIPK